MLTAAYISIYNIHVKIVYAYSRLHLPVLSDALWPTWCGKLDQCLRLCHLIPGYCMYHGTTHSRWGITYILSLSCYPVLDTPLLSCILISLSPSILNLFLTNSHWQKRVLSVGLYLTTWDTYGLLNTWVSEMYVPAANKIKILEYSSGRCPIFFFFFFKQQKMSVF